MTFLHCEQSLGLLLEINSVVNLIKNNNNCCFFKDNVINMYFVKVKFIIYLHIQTYSLNSL